MSLPDSPMPSAPARTVVRRRGGVEVSRHQQGADGTVRTTLMLDGGAKRLSVVERVRAAADRMRQSLAGQRAVHSTKEMRADQATVFTDFAAYLGAAVAHLAEKPDEPFAYARVVQPPRTGKTIIMGEFVSGTGATAVVLVPTVDLVRQTAASLREQLPNVSVGVYHGEEKQLVSSGIVVATYQIVKARHAEGKIPPAIANATFVFWDEGHHAMTDNCADLRVHGFQPGTLHIAFTATPDYDEKRTLAAHFPYLIHEITLEEALELKLFAPLKVKVVSVHADGSRVRLSGKDFDQRELGEIMSAEAFLEATRVIRWTVDDNAAVPALICCADKTQARNLHAYLCARRPPGAAEPALVTEDTKHREKILAAFEAGEIDTLVNVAVLLEGWNSPRCKLEIDLAPSLSEVRAKQKYFRVMTRADDALARIYVLVPDTLSRIPIFPQSLFGQAVEVEGYEDWMRRQPRKKPTAKEARPATKPAAPTEGLRVITQVVYEFDSTKVRLNPRDQAQIRSVIATKFAVAVKNPLPKFGEFLEEWFETELFTGYGAHLLRYCGCPLRRKYFLRLLTRLYPEVVASRRLKQDGFEYDLECLPRPEDPRAFGYLFSHVADAVDEEAPRAAAGSGPWADPYYDIEEHVDQIIKIKFVLAQITDERTSILTTRERFVLERYLLADEELSYADIGKEMGLSHARVAQIAAEAYWKFRAKLLIGADP